MSHNRDFEPTTCPIGQVPTFRGEVWPLQRPRARRAVRLLAAAAPTPRRRRTMYDRTGRVGGGRPAADAWRDGGDGAVAFGCGRAGRAGGAPVGGGRAPLGGGDRLGCDPVSEPARPGAGGPVQGAKHPEPTIGVPVVLLVCGGPFPTSLSLRWTESTLFF